MYAHLELMASVGLSLGPPLPKLVMPETATDISLERPLQRIGLFLGLIVVGLGITFCVVASSFCITILASAFLAILLDPLVTRLEKLRFGRGLASVVVIVGAVVIAVAIAFGVYRQASGFSEQIPIYSRRIQKVLNPIIHKVERVKDNASSIITPDGSSKKVPEVKVKQSPSWASALLRGFGSASSIFVIIGVVPFLTFFLLLQKEHMYLRFAAMFERRIDVERFITTIEVMIRGFVIGNLVVGSIMAGATSLMLLLLGMKNPFVLGIVTGILNLIPFLGLLLAEAVAGLAGIVQFTSVGPFLIMLLVIACLHLIAGNMLVPRLIGARVSVGPVAVTVGILFWGWIWGVFGVILAVPLTALVKAIADTQPSLIHVSNFLAEKPTYASFPRSRLSSYLRLRKSGVKAL